VLFQANAIFTWLFGLFGITVAHHPLPLLAVCSWCSLHRPTTFALQPAPHGAEATDA